MTENSGAKQASSKPKGRWSKGESGNPKGKPRGARHRVTILAEKLMADDAEEIVKAVTKAAKEGDMTAARLVLERIAPLRKGRPVSLELPEIATAADLVQAMAKVAEAMGNGQITPEEAATVAGVLEMRRKALETVELEQRIAALESQVTK